MIIVLLVVMVVVELFCYCLMTGGWLTARSFVTNQSERISNPQVKGESVHNGGLITINQSLTVVSPNNLSLVLLGFPGPLVGRYLVISACKMAVSLCKVFMS